MELERLAPSRPPSTEPSWSSLRETRRNSSRLFDTFIQQMNIYMYIACNTDESAMPGGREGREPDLGRRSHPPDGCDQIRQAPRMRRKSYAAFREGKIQPGKGLGMIIV